MLADAARPHAGFLVLGVSCLVGASAAVLVLPILAGRLVDAATSGVSLAAEVPLVLCALAVHVILDALGRYLVAFTGERLVYDLRARLVRRIVRAELESLNSHRTGDLISRVSADTTLLRDAITRGVVEVFLGALFLVGAGVLMARLDLLMFSVSAVILVLTVGGASFFLGQVREAAQRAQTRLGELGADLERVVSAIRTVRMAGAEDVEATRLSGTAAAARDAGIRVARSIALVSPIAQVAASGALLAVLLVGAARVGAGSLELSTLVSFLLYTLYLLTPLNGLIDGTSVIRRAQGTLERIDEVLELPIEDTGTSPRSEPPLRAKIEKPALSLEGVHFGYADRSEVLSDVNLRVAAGRRIALVGPSGGGKTTLFSLICRLHTPRYGTIAVAGHDLSTAGYRARALVALVEQDSPILFGSVRDNLLIGAPDVNDDRLREAVERVQMTDEIDKMPNGMDTDVGEHGQFISGGQRQRLAIARALLREPSLLLLDEPTSSLDEDNERAVLTVIRELPPSQSALIISHRPSTLEMVDEILLLDQGQVRTIGSYENLARLDPEYRFHH